MKKALSYAKEFFHRADIFLLVMGLICATFGIIVISSATASYHSAKYVIVQSASLILGVVAFAAMTVLDVDVLADKWQILCAFNALFLLLLIPFGVSDNTGNTGWLRFFGIGIQPTEVVKLTFIVVLAKADQLPKEYTTSTPCGSVAQLAVHFVLLFGLDPLRVVRPWLGADLLFHLPRDALCRRLCAALVCHRLCGHRRDDPAAVELCAARLSEKPHSRAL